MALKWKGWRLQEKHTRRSFRRGLLSALGYHVGVWLHWKTGPVYRNTHSRIRIVFRSVLDKWLVLTVKFWHIPGAFPDWNWTCEFKESDLVMIMRPELGSFFSQLARSTRQTFFLRLPWKPSWYNFGLDAFMSREKSSLCCSLWLSLLTASNFRLTLIVSIWRKMFQQPSRLFSFYFTCIFYLGNVKSWLISSVQDYFLSFSFYFSLASNVLVYTPSQGKNYELRMKLPARAGKQHPPIQFFISCPPKGTGQKFSTFNKFE